MNAIKNIIERASKLNGTVVLPEGQDARVITAACACVERKLATPVVLGTAEEIAAAEAKAGKKLSDFGIEVIDYTTGEIVESSNRERGICWRSWLRFIMRRGTRRKRRSRLRSRS